MPFADLGAFDKDRRLSAISDLFTVGLVIRYITWKLGQGAGNGTNGNAGVLFSPVSSPAGQG